ncbi:methyltransferase domain-containing protein [Alteromonas sediminis]|uniref:Methyltransferase domain-containing protein n=1 Tax=Alteromonas sediminis TaxID=2259342 RepID=A0A3N5Z6R3_9ALTE|nr:methyltransferase [Alteromonas sediminis]RPJ66274.1 methyltransferase domain-containing protein [Alteromonas sediminis]
MFRCKQFTIDDALCAMKVTTDSLIFGSWVNLEYASHVLDVGCGSGILTLMALQKTSKAAKVDAIDIDKGAVSQCNANIANSPWRERAKAQHVDFLTLSSGSVYSHIVSNPPYFPSATDAESGHAMHAQRKLARQQTAFTPQRFFEKAAQCGSNDTHVSIVFPYAQYAHCIEAAKKYGMSLHRLRHVRSVEEKQPYLSMMTFGKCTRLTQIEPILTIYNHQHQYTDDFRTLCRAFYLRF